MKTFHKKEKNKNLGAILLGCAGRTFKRKDCLDSQAEPKDSIDSNFLTLALEPHERKTY